VSGDKHLLKLGQYQGIKIVSPADFIPNAGPAWARALSAIAGLRAFSCRHRITGASLKNIANRLDRVFGEARIE
jgi:hypothetical protein